MDGMDADADDDADADADDDDDDGEAIAANSSLMELFHIFLSLFNRS